MGASSLSITALIELLDPFRDAQISRLAGKFLDRAMYEEKPGIPMARTGRAAVYNSMSTPRSYPLSTVHRTACQGQHLDNTDTTTPAVST